MHIPISYSALTDMEKVRLLLPVLSGNIKVKQYHLVGRIIYVTLGSNMDMLRLWKSICNDPNYKYHDSLWGYMSLYGYSDHISLETILIDLRISGMMEDRVDIPNILNRVSTLLPELSDRIEKSRYIGIKYPTIEIDSHIRSSYYTTILEHMVLRSNPILYDLITTGSDIRSKL